MISVCMATYNGEKFIRKQVDSILKQLSVDDELIISDDGSSDGTIKILESYHDDRIKIVHHEKKDKSDCKILNNFHKTAQNFENALKAASGDYIFLSDQDDIWAEDKVTKFVDLLKKNIFVISNFSVIDSHGNIIKKVEYEIPPVTDLFISNFIHQRFMNCCSAFRKELLPFILPFPKRIKCSDSYIGLIASLRGKISYIHEPLIFYRRHGSNVSSASSKSKNSLFVKIYYRLEIFFQVVKKIYSR